MGKPVKRPSTGARGSRAGALHAGTELLTVLDAAKMAGVDPDTIRFWQGHKGLPAFRTRGGVRVFDRDQLLKFLLKRFVNQLATQPAKRRGIP